MINFRKRIASRVAKAKVDYTYYDFTVEFKDMSEHNMKKFLTMLRYMEYLGNIGHSTDFKVWVDGDGAARIKMDVKDVKKREVEMNYNEKTEKTKKTEKITDVKFNMKEIEDDMKEQMDKAKNGDIESFGLE